MANLRLWRNSESLEDALQMRQFMFELSDYRDKIISLYTKYAFNGLNVGQNPILVGKLRGLLDQYFYWVDALCALEVHKYTDTQGRPLVPHSNIDMWREIWNNAVRSGPKLMNEGNLAEVDVILETLHSAFGYMESQNTMSNSMFIEALQQSQG